jgi:hypothetical protein
VRGYGLPVRKGLDPAHLVGIAVLVAAVSLAKLSTGSAAPSYECQPPTTSEDIACIDDDGYNFTAGELVFEPGEEFCDDFRCAAEFATGSGYVVQCSDGLFSREGGVRHACEAHGGVTRALFER